MICNIKHTKYQPTVEEFFCPKCYARAGIFCVEDSANMECELLHLGDSLQCSSCQYNTSGKAFVAHLIKKQNLAKCEHCNGAGFVRKKRGGE